MPNGWSGVDPSPIDDGISTTFELATHYRAEADITVNAIRVFGGPTSLDIVGRAASIRTLAGTVLGSKLIDTTLAPGWSTFLLNAPVEILSGSEFFVEYGTRQYYAATAGNYPESSADGNVTALAGAFHNTIGSTPDTFTASFYGVDIAYTVGVVGNVAPEVTGLTLTAVGRTVTAVATATDTDPLTYAFHWGDGTVTFDADGTAPHTYATDGMYAVMVVASDPDGLHDAYAGPIEVFALPAGTDIPAATLIARHWLASLPGLSPIQVGQQLQTPYDSWTSDFFITVSDIESLTDAYTPLRSHRIQVDVWGRPKPSQRANTVPFNRCVSLAERISEVTRPFSPTEIVIGSPAYLGIDLKDVMVVSEPRRIIERKPENSQVAIGRASMELQFTYMPMYQ